MSYISDLLDSILADTIEVSSFFGEAKCCYDEQEPYKCTLSLTTEEYDEDNAIDITYYSPDGTIPSEGIAIKLFGGTNGYIDAHNFEYEFSEDQVELLTDFLNQIKNFKYFQDATRWYSREKAIKRISELVKDGMISWKKLEPEILEPYETGVDYQTEYCTYKAEYEDVILHYSYLDDEEALEKMREEAGDENDPAAFYDYMDYSPTLTIMVGDYYQNNIHDLSEDEINLIFGKGDEDDEEVETLDVKDLIVKTNMAGCVNKGHRVSQITANVYAINKFTFQKELRSARAYYCDTCKRYYIRESDFNDLSAGCVLCCQVVDVSDLESGNYEKWAKKSILRIYGYNVNQQENLSDDERHVILDMVIGNGVLSKARCIEFIEWLISRYAGRPNYDIAISRWNRDIDYLKSGKRTVPANVMIGRIKTNN